MKFRGSGRLSLTAEGDLALEDGGVRLVQKRPSIYQQDPASPVRRSIGGKYKLLGRNVVAVEVERYDRSLPLTIDPVVVYASFLGGSLGDAVTALKVDSHGMLYVYGYTNNGDLAATNGAYKTATAGSRDVFLAKIDPTQSGAASLVYFTYIGGTGMDTSTGMALDSAGNVYLTGYTTSTDFPTAGSPFQSALAGGTGTDAREPGLRRPGLLDLLGRYRPGSGQRDRCGCLGSHLRYWLDPFRRLPADVFGLCGGPVGFPGCFHCEAGPGSFPSVGIQQLPGR
jgi:hypothetical protein